MSTCSIDTMKVTGGSSRIRLSLSQGIRPRARAGGRTSQKVSFFLRYDLYFLYYARGMKFNENVSIIAFLPRTPQFSYHRSPHPSLLRFPNLSLRAGKDRKVQISRISQQWHRTITVAVDAIMTKFPAYFQQSYHKIYDFQLNLREIDVNVSLPFCKSLRSSSI